MGLLLGACSGDDTHLPALLADPMANYEAEGIELVDSWEQAEGTEWLSGKPVHARVQRTYRIADQDKAESILGRVVAVAESEGWVLRPSLTSPTTGFRGTKDLGPDSGRLTLSLAASDPLDDPDGPRVLRVHLDFGPVYFDETTTSMAGGD